MLFYLSDCLPIQELSSTRSNARVLLYLSDCLPIQELSSTRSSCAPPLPHLVVQQPRPVVFVSRPLAHHPLPVLVEEPSTAHDLRHPRHHPPQRIRQCQELDGRVGSGYRSNLRHQIGGNHLWLLGQNVEKSPRHRGGAGEQQIGEHHSGTQLMHPHTVRSGFHQLLTQALSELTQPPLGGFVRARRLAKRRAPLRKSKVVHMVPLWFLRHPLTVCP
mmetsp:Transcript_28415/g.45500  ORF Transcript_28415/g.45500 Transcript_28415/m.45500 type:complete len:217 (-) Transcript_28415:287-937(-)